ncbi:hypothetical protein B0H66DRAFT_578322 [Apodospora peruviana]|uniref:Uncharacterized protein n=1 Tax=Apodospora peruviana TaxID=516989 RepID=A0AAE0HUJ9_9PEZI|nr:hypothetical protein B0H66DRAFT_578322 [Apodospora peruviana]
MPLALLSSLTNRNINTSDDIFISSLAANVTTNNTAEDAIQVICAWPLSGQYGLGSRILYYALVTTCVFARKADWLRNACLAAALIIPAVAALHGITLAALHVEGAVDMDIYGAFQACCIGILAAPITVKMSKTYFNDPARNTIYLWTILILAGLLSLMVEFYRVSETPCSRDDFGNLLTKMKEFPYEQASCNLTCSIQKGPFSSMRTDALNNIYVIPAPTTLTSGTATLIAAGCCIPAILLLVSMWNKILEINWNARFSRRNEDDNLDEVIEGTNNATPRKINKVNDWIASFLSVVQALVFGGGVLAIVILGEINFNSASVRYQTEPMASIGQWGPVVGAALAALGSLYVVLVHEPEAKEVESASVSPVHHCDCAHHHYGSRTSFKNGAEGHTIGGPIYESPGMMSAPFPPMPSYDRKDLQRGATMPVSGFPFGVQESDEKRQSFHSERGRSLKRSPGSERPPETEQQDAGNRLKFMKTLGKISEKLGTAPPDLFDDSAFREGKAADYPLLPGEEWRNPDLQVTKELYEDGNARSRSRAPSFRASFEDGGSRAPSPNPSISRQRRSNTMGGSTHASRSETRGRAPSSPSSTFTPGRLGPRRATLEVPGASHRDSPSSRHNSSPAAIISLFNPVHDGEPQSPISPITPPAIVLSPDPETYADSPSPGASPSTSAPPPPH